MVAIQSVAGGLVSVLESIKQHDKKLGRMSDSWSGGFRPPHRRHHRSAEHLDGVSAPWGRTIGRWCSPHKQRDS